MTENTREALAFAWVDSPLRIGLRACWYALLVLALLTAWGAPPWDLSYANM